MEKMQCQSSMSHLAHNSAHSGLVRNIFELRAVFALLPLPDRPRLSCRVSGLVSFYSRSTEELR